MGQFPQQPFRFHSRLLQIRRSALGVWIAGRGLWCLPALTAARCRRVTSIDRWAASRCSSTLLNAAGPGSAAALAASRLAARRANPSGAGQAEATPSLSVCWLPRAASCLMNSQSRAERRNSS